MSWPRRHRSNTMTSEANTEDDLEVDSNQIDEDDAQVKVEAWLDEHPEFFQEYLIRKGSCIGMLCLFSRRLLKN